MRRSLSLLVLAALLAGCTGVPVPSPSPSTSSSSVASIVSAGSAFGASVAYQETPTRISPELAADFPLDEIVNLADMEKAYGVTFTPDDRLLLQERKFVMKRLPDTSIRPTIPSGSADWFREFLALYNSVRGPSDDYKGRRPEHAVFLSADLFLHSYHLLYDELLKEMETTVFAPSMEDLSKAFFEAAHAKAAGSGADAATWMKVRNYFAVPYALLATAADPPSTEEYFDVNGNPRDPEAIRADFQAKDSSDTEADAARFVGGLGLDPESAQRVLTDLTSVFAAEGTGMPAILKEEYEAYAAQEKIAFEVDFTQFTPRSHYTGTSRLRQYFRSMMWFSQLPFFLKSPALTQQAFAMSQLLAEHPEQLASYSKLESAVNFLVGGSDDLMPADYLAALDAAKGSADQEKAVTEYLAKARNPKIKGIPAAYPSVGDLQTADVLLATKGMRFFSGKFIVDSYWTGRLTQGDEAPLPGYTQKLPPMASSLQVMALLGSDYARSRIPSLDFYTADTKEAIDKAMRELTDETVALEQEYWSSNLYTTWLWTLKGLFGWEKEHAALLPRFMQSEGWRAKTLQTAAGSWTELRHDTLLYAKQSFAEMGAGPPACDTREVPPPPKGYVEPQLQAYDRLRFLADRTRAGLTEAGFGELRNMPKLDAFLDALNVAHGFVARQLGNETFVAEKLKDVTVSDPFEDGKDCVTHEIDGDSDWETIRTGIIDRLVAALPQPTEGPVLSAKDKRAAIIADVHTGGDFANPRRVLYEATGVPNVIFVAVKDANGPRLTVGFTYAQHEFTELHGGPRLTDEDWQKEFYAGDDVYQPFDYTDAAGWPAINPWYAPLFGR